MVQSNQAPKDKPAPSTQLPIEGSPTPVGSLDIIKGTTPPPTSTPTPTPSPTPVPIAVTKATITTQYGDIVLELYPKELPLTVDNFARKVKSGFYNGLIFHRVEDWVIQGGDPKGDGTGGGEMQTESSNRPYVAGSLGMARRSNDPYTNDSQFFITKTNEPSLTGQYPNFGTVTSGIDIVNKVVAGDKIIKITVE